MNLIQKFESTGDVKDNVKGSSQRKSVHTERNATHVHEVHTCSPYSSIKCSSQSTGVDFFTDETHFHLNDTSVNKLMRV